MNMTLPDGSVKQFDGPVTVIVDSRQ